MKNCSVFASLISPSKMILFEKKYQTFDTVFHHQMKHLEVRQKYSAARCIFNSLLGVSSGDETLRHCVIPFQHLVTQGLSFICLTWLPRPKRGKSLMTTLVYLIWILLPIELLIKANSGEKQRCNYDNNGCLTKQAVWALVLTLYLNWFTACSPSR